jgi:hypothetical protein
MKRLYVVFVVVLTLSLVAFGQKAKPSAEFTGEKAVRASFEDLVRAIENSNVNGATQPYWNSPELQVFNHNGTVTKGWEQNRKNREDTYPKIKNVKLETRDVRITMLGTSGALVTFLWRQTRDYEDKAESASGRTTLVYKKIGKDWKIVHLHTSPDNAPADRPVFNSERLRIEKT